MHDVEEIERAILELSAEDFARVAQRIQAIEEERWDRQLDADAAAGKLDFLVQEARTVSHRGQLRDWPDSKS